MTWSQPRWPVLLIGALRSIYVLRGQRSLSNLDLHLHQQPATTGCRILDNSATGAIARPSSPDPITLHSAFLAAVIGQIVQPWHL